MRRHHRFTLVCVLAGALTAAPLLQAPAPAQADANALAKQQQNPISSLVSIPLQFNFNTGGWKDQGFLLLNAQPVIPFRLNDGWNAVSRTVVPIASMPGPTGPVRAASATSRWQLYLTPSKSQKVVWGAGPVVSAPMSNSAACRPAAWAAGPTFVALTMPGPWVIGALVNRTSDVLQCRRRTEDEPVPAAAVRQLQLRQGMGRRLGTAHYGQLGRRERPAVDRPDRRRHQPHHGVLGTAHGPGRALLPQRCVQPDAAAGGQLRFMWVLLFPKK